MLPRKNRIPRIEFPEVLSGKRFFNSAHFTLRSVPAKDVRLAVSVSKKVSKSAVDRNGIRRRAYSAIAKEINALRPGYYLFIAKKSAEKVRGESLYKEISELLKASERV